MSTGGYPELHTWDAKGVCKNCGVNFKQVIHEQVMAVEAIRRELEAERRRFRRKGFMQPRPDGKASQKWHGHAENGNRRDGF